GPRGERPPEAKGTASLIRDHQLQFISNLLVARAPIAALGGIENVIPVSFACSPLQRLDPLIELVAVVPSVQRGVDQLDGVGVLSLVYKTSRSKKQIPWVAALNFDVLFPTIADRQTQVDLC